ARRGRGPRRWGLALPAVVAGGLVAALVMVVPVLDDSGEGQAESGTDTAAGGTGQESSGESRIGDDALSVSGARTAEVECTLPELSSDRERLAEFYRAELRCLDRAWEPALAEAGLPFRPAEVDIADSPDTACGPLPPRERATGLYCSEDGTIYLPRTRTVDAFGLATEAHLATLAHEYGHHVQYLSGILGDAGRALGRHAAEGPGDRELSRRVELQANCLAGMFLHGAQGRGGIDRALAGDAVDDFRNWIDSDTHGSAETQREWALRGYRDGSMSACNTWRAPDERVE
ncbi:neutral zinc metallopeptidase, partial [Saccharomonospora halophila]|uniref:neutral zinc metallopeptidase n=1 Tax=Saccharomonospora halophila TaxID=129922 RepID=UPI0012FA054B